MPHWLDFDLLAPPKVSSEQASSFATAQYKASLIKKNSTLLDMTGGLGIDSFAFAKECSSLIHNEMNIGLSEVVKENFKRLRVKNVHFTNFKAEEYPFLSVFDTIYIDPARRDESQSKVFKIEDCSPNMVALLPTILEHSDQILLKLSPLLDLKACLQRLHSVAEIHIVSLKNEVKELLFVIKKSISIEVIPRILCLDLGEKEMKKYSFDLDQESKSIPILGSPKRFLYEPMASIYKAGAFKSIAIEFNLQKLSPNSHLYFSDQLISNFPGKIFETLHILQPNKKEIISSIDGKNAHVVVRNYPKNSEEIKKEMGLIEKGDHYLFFTEDNTKKKMVLHCKKILV
ncbi:MAG: THUMP-like domain-containing protein [Leadbetterella sp.]